MLLNSESGFVSNVVTSNISLDRVDVPIHIYQTNGGHSYVHVLNFAYRHSQIRSWRQRGCVFKAPVQ